MLKDILDKHNSDKSSKHHYHLLYEKDFINFKNKKIKILEVGILSGSSLKTWLEYFINAEIYAIDIVDKNKVEILNNERIKYIQCDSTDETIVEQVKKWDTKFDIIIDDGLHVPEANKKTFINLFPFLQKNGTYYIEDFFPMHIMTIEDYNSKSGQWLLNKQDVWNKKLVNDFLEFIHLYNYETFDNRKISKYQDSYIIKITKN